MKAVRRFFLILIGVPLLVAGSAAFLLRHGRGNFGTAFELRSGLAQVMFSGAHVYAYAERAGDKILLFDAGADPEGKGLDALLASLYASRNQVEDIFLTHGHGDHFAGAAGFPHVRVHAGAEDVDLIARKVWPDRWLAAAIAMLSPLPAVDVTDPITGAGEIAVGGGKTVRAIPVPGHTPGSYAYLYEGILFVGDTLSLDHGKLGVGPAVFTSNPAEQKESIESLKAVLAKVPVDMVCTGHGGCSRAGEGKQTLERATASVGNWAPLF